MIDYTTRRIRRAKFPDVDPQALGRYAMDSTMWRNFRTNVLLPNDQKRGWRSSALPGPGFRSWTTNGSPDALKQETGLESRINASDIPLATVTGVFAVTAAVAAGLGVAGDSYETIVQDDGSIALSSTVEEKVQYGPLSISDETLLLTGVGMWTSAVICAVGLLGRLKKPRR